MVWQICKPLLKGTDIFGGALNRKVNTVLPGTSKHNVDRLKSSNRSLKIKLKTKNESNLSLETLYKCKICLNAKPVEIKSSVHQALHGF